MYPYQNNRQQVPSPSNSRGIVYGGFGQPQMPQMKTGLLGPQVTYAQMAQGRPQNHQPAGFGYPQPNQGNPFLQQMQQPQQRQVHQQQQPPQVQPQHLAPNNQIQQQQQTNKPTYAQMAKQPPTLGKMVQSPNQQPLYQSNSNFAKSPSNHRSPGLIIPSIADAVEVILSRENFTMDPRLITILTPDLFVPLVEVMKFSEVLKIIEVYQFEKWPTSQLISTFPGNSALFSTPGGLNMDQRIYGLSMVVVDELKKRMNLGKLSLEFYHPSPSALPLIKPIFKAERNVVILRDLPADVYSEKEIAKLFEGTPGHNHISSIKSEFNDTWFIAFTNEEIATSTALELKVSGKKDPVSNKALQIAIKNVEQKASAPQVSSTDGNFLSPEHQQFAQTMLINSASSQFSLRGRSKSGASNKPLYPSGEFVPLNQLIEQQNGKELPHELSTDQTASTGPQKQNQQKPKKKKSKRSNTITTADVINPGKPLTTSIQTTTTTTNPEEVVPKEVVQRARSKSEAGNLTNFGPIKIDRIYDADFIMKKCNDIQFILKPDFNDYDPDVVLFNPHKKWVMANPLVDGTAGVVDQVARSKMKQASKQQSHQQQNQQQKGKKGKKGGWAQKA